MTEQPYIKVEVYIRQTPTGIKRTDKLLGISSNIPTSFIDALRDDYSIDINKLLRSNTKNGG